MTAYDLTSNANNGTLSGFGGDLPTWTVAAGEAIDLGGDAITYNASSPRQGPNNYQNFPSVVTTASGGLEGWLGGSTPDTTFLVDVYASAGYSAEGAGQAEDFLGSLEVTTDQTGQVVFAVPFTAPVGLPIITATATDPVGNTSEISAARRSTLDAPTQFVRIAAGEPVTLSAASGDGIAIEDPDAGPLDAEWRSHFRLPGALSRCRAWPAWWARATAPGACNIRVHFRHSTRPSTGSCILLRPGRQGRLR